MILFHKHFPPLKTICISLLLMAVLSIMLCLFPQIVGDDETKWVLVFVVIMIISMLNGLMQSTSYGIVGVFPYECIVSLNTGCALSGVVISVLRAFSLIVFPTDDDDDNPNYFNGALLYFILGAIAQILNIALVFLASKTDFYRFYMNNRDQQPQDQVEESGLLNGGSPNSNSAKEVELKQYSAENNETEGNLANILKVHNQMAILGWGLAVIYIQTFLVFPAVLLVGRLDFVENISWQVWLIITIFNIFDMVSRFVTEKYMILTTKTTVIATALRSVFIAFAFLSAYDVSFFGNDTFKIINIIILGFTNGYIGNCQIIIGCTEAKQKDKELTSKFMAFFLVLGILIGSLITSFGIEKLF